MQIVCYTILYILDYTPDQYNIRRCIYFTIDFTNTQPHLRHSLHRQPLKCNDHAITRCALITLANLLATANALLILQASVYIVSASVIIMAGMVGPVNAYVRGSQLFFFPLRE